jgi:putative nucleotidyltransferase with HDIG domain
MHRVRFVYDQPGILLGLERMLAPMRSKWKMIFATDPAAALDSLSQEPADVVVSDMRMPELDGVAFLREIRARWPETIRIVLSGYADQGDALRSLPVAHQFLAKPCDPDVLVAKVREAFELQERLGRPELRRLIGALGSLPAAPRSFSAITEALAAPEVDLGRVGRIIERDPGCSAKLLQLVNSAFFGLPRSVTRVSEAVTYLGATRIRDVVLAAEVSEMFKCASPQTARTVQVVNDHSQAVAMAARKLVGPRLAHEAFTAGILHDIGRLALSAALPREYDKVTSCWREGGSLVALERETFGADHADVGAYLLRMWGLPLPLVEAVARHHDLDSPTATGSPLVCAVATADAQAEAEEEALATAQDSGQPDVQPGGRTACARTTGGQS